MIGLVIDHLSSVICGYLPPSTDSHCTNTNRRVAFLLPSDTELTGPILECFKGFFETTETAEYFYSNDLNVLIDIALREILNLPVQSTNRANYVQTIHLALVNSNWIQTKYRRCDILSALESLLDMGERTIGVASSSAIELMLSECLDFLEGDD